MASIAHKARDWFRNESTGTRLPIQQHASYLPHYPVSYFGPLSQFFGDIDRMFANTLSNNWVLRNFSLPQITGAQGMGMLMFQPNVDILASDNEYTVTAEVPGLEENDIKLDLSADGQLTISGEKRQESTENRQDVYCTECSYGAFERILSLPEDIDRDNIEARFKNGVLTITCPRTQHAKQARRQIPIGGGKSGEAARPGNTNERNVSAQAPRKAA